MSGILDSKQRVMDTVITQFGRQKMATGRFRLKYVSFTDNGTFYKADVVSGSADTSNRIFLEACQLPQDQITFDSDDSGKLMPIGNTSGYEIISGKIFSGSSVGLEYITGSDFASTSETLLGASIDNFQRLQAIGTIDSIFEDDEFLLSHDEITFTVTNKTPILDPNVHSINVNHLESFFADKKLSHTPNFQFMPPLNKVLDESADLNDPIVKEQYHLGDYKPLGSSPLDFANELLPEIAAAEKRGNVKTVTFDPTTNANSIAAQFFELRSDELLKLDVIDFGTYRSNDPSISDHHVYFVGKVFVDDYGSHTFVRLFTLVFE